MGTQEPLKFTEENRASNSVAGGSNNISKISLKNSLNNSANNENSYNSVSTQANPNITNNKNVTLTTTGKKIRRAFSMPRNPFRWSRKFKTINTDSNSNKNTSEISINNDEKITDVRVTIIGQENTTQKKLHESSNEQQQYENKKNGSNNFTTTANRVFRRSSFRKFLTRIAQHVTLTHKHSTTSPIVSDRVPPIGGYQWPADQTPGVTGLKNHGNTCFMNAVLQCLSHTDILAEYFVLDQYKADLKRRNKINSRKFGTKGELTEELANVLKALWTCKNESEHSTSFKAVVDRYGTQFRSSTQHDAQEFLFWLLDKVHEDLNTATKRKYKNVKNNYGRPDEIIAAETLANHIRCNNSFVQAVFQAQFRSSLTCPRCKKQSNTFDPFHCISVQLPQLTTQTIFVTVLYVKQHPQQVKLGLTVPAGSAIIALRQQLNADTGIETSHIVLADINTKGFSRVFYDSQPISTLEGINSIYCIEVPDIKETSSTDLMLLIANVHKLKDGTVKRFGTPFCVQVTRDCSYVELQKKLLKQMSTILKPEVFGYTTPLNEMFQMRLQDPSADPDTYLEQVEHPLFTEIIDMALSVLSADAGPPHIKLLLEWPNPEEFFADLNDAIVEHESVSRLKDVKSNESSLTLEQCLEHYTKAETLSAEDAWRCPHCQQYLPVVKTLGLWSLPDILVIHFKRFRQHHDKGADAAKLTTMVKFPLNAFDMSPHLAKESSNSNDSLNVDSHLSLYNRNPWNKFRDNVIKSKEIRDNRYDLYAVCYHQGDTLETGHYTAACKNPYDHQWYKFDDQRVTHVLADDVQEQIINNEAYILFYQRRNIENNECSGASSSISGDHWVSKIAVTASSLTTSVNVSNGSTLGVSGVLENKEKTCIELESSSTELETIKPLPPSPPVIDAKEDEVSILVNVEDLKFADEDDKKPETYNIDVEQNVQIETHLESVLEVNTVEENPSLVISTNSNKINEIRDKEILNHKTDSNAEKLDISSISSSNSLRPNKSITSSIESIVSQSKDIIQVIAVKTTPIHSHKFMNGFNNSDQFKEAISSSLKSNNSLMMNAISNDLNCALRGSTSSNSGHCVSLRHSISNSSNYKLKECNDTLSSMLRNSTSTCSKDTLIFIDQQGQSLIEDDDSYLGSRSLWISPVTPHKLITVSPKN